MSALATIQAAMRERLTAEFDVSVLVSDRIYDGEAPQGAALPYVVIGSATEDDAGPLGRAGYRDTLMLHVWSSYPGRSEALGIWAAIEAALATPLTLSGHTAARLKLRVLDVLVEEDGVRHLVGQGRIFTFASA